MHNVFVYGSLMSGFGLHDALSASRYLGKYKTSPEWQLYSLGPYPAAIFGDNCIEGELYSVTDEVLQKLDYIEGHPTYYERVRTFINGERAWIYKFVDDDLHNYYKKVEDGDWRKYCADRNQKMY